MISPLLHRLKGWGPLLAGLGSIGAIGGLLLIVWAPELRVFAIPTLTVAGLLLVLAAAASLGYVVDAVTGRRGQLSWVTLASVASVIAIVVVLNVIASVTDATWDLTATNQFELSPQTTQVLAALREDVDVTGFVITTDEDDLRYQATAEGFLRQFAKHAGNRLSYRFIDPELEPSTARELGVTGAPALLFTSPATSVRASIESGNFSEQDLLTAILRVTGERRHVVYFISGHGERSISDLRSTGDGLGLAAAGLRADGYEVRTLDLAARGGVPEDASLIVVAAPRTRLDAEEEGLITQWLADDGRALFLLDASSDVREASSGLLAAWGLEIVEGTIVDPERSVTGDARTLTPHRDQYYGQTSITEGGVIIELLGSTLFPGATALRPSGEVASRIERDEPVPVRFEPLITTSAASWVAEGLDDQAPDVGASGPHSIHLAVQASSPVTGGLTEAFDPAVVRTTFAVIGDADFASNRHFNDLSNADLFLNTVNWLLEDEALISVRSKQEVFRPLVLTSPEFDLVRYVSWFLLPALIAGIGVVAWWRRR